MEEYTGSVSEDKREGEREGERGREGGRERERAREGGREREREREGESERVREGGRKGGREKETEGNVFLRCVHGHQLTCQLTVVPPVDVYILFPFPCHTLHPVEWLITNTNTNKYI